MSPLGVVGGSHSTSAKYGLLMLKVVIIGGVPGAKIKRGSNKMLDLCKNYKCPIIQSLIIVVS
jgi:hypothetical protein